MTVGVRRSALAGLLLPAVLLVHWATDRETDDDAP